MHPDQYSLVVVVVVVVVVFFSKDLLPAFIEIDVVVT